MKTVTIYSTPTCHYCHMAKEFFQNNGIEFTDYNVAEDSSKREEMVELTGQMGVPVIKIDDQTMVGFNEAKLRESLAEDMKEGSAASEASESAKEEGEEKGEDEAPAA